MDFPTINLALTGANIMNLRKAAGLSVHDLQMAFGFNSPQAIYKWQNGGSLTQRYHTKTHAYITSKQYNFGGKPYEKADFLRL